MDGGCLSEGLKPKTQQLTRASVGKCTQQQRIWAEGRRRESTRTDESKTLHSSIDIEQTDTLFLRKTFECMILLWFVPISCTLKASGNTSTYRINPVCYIKISEPPTHTKKTRRRKDPHKRHATKPPIFRTTPFTPPPHTYTKKTAPPTNSDSTAAGEPGLVASSVTSFHPFSTPKENPIPNTDQHHHNQGR